MKQLNTGSQIQNIHQTEIEMTEQIMKDGFYPALGTPTDEVGKLVAHSYNKQIELMLGAGAKGFLCMGSMGKMTGIRDQEYPEIAKQCVETVLQRVPVMVGVMDCSVARVTDRIEALGSLKIDGVVATVPYYYKINQDEIVNFYTMLSKRSEYPLYIYDLPSVTQSPVTPQIIEKLIKLPNIKGLKTANLELILHMQRNNDYNNDFSVFFSGLDLFDVALNAGIGKNLDGMYTCTPVNSGKMYAEAAVGNDKAVKEYLNNIIRLRNIFLKGNIFSAYTYAMKLLGCPGNYHTDFDLPIPEELKEEIHGFMKAIKEL